MEPAYASRPKRLLGQLLDGVIGLVPLLLIFLDDALGVVLTA